MANFNEGRQAIQAPGAGLAPVAGRSKIRSAQGLTRPGAAAEYNRRTPDAGRRTPDAGRRTPDAGRRTPDAGRRTPDAGRRTPDAGRASCVFMVAPPRAIRLPA